MFQVSVMPSKVSFILVLGSHFAVFLRNGVPLSYRNSLINGLSLFIEKTISQRRFFQYYDIIIIVLLIQRPGINN